MSASTDSGSSHHHGHRNRALLAAGLSAILFGAATPVSKSLLTEVPAPVLAGLFYLGAALSLAPSALRGSRRDEEGRDGERGFLGWPRDARTRRLLFGAGHLPD